MSIKRSRFLIGVIFLVWGVVGVRLFWLSIWSLPPGARDGFAPKTETAYGPRGNIYDRNGEPLAMSEKVYELYLDGKAIPGGEAGARVVYEKLKMTLGEDKRISLQGIIKVVKSGLRYYKPGVVLNEDEMAVIKSAGLSGVGFEPKIRRVYPEGELARELLGICGTEGRTGVEYAFDRYLKGKPFVFRRQRDGAGRNIAEDFYFDDSVKGDDVYLTIDKNIQFIAERAASDTLNETGASKVMVVVQDPNTGEILALASKVASRVGGDGKENNRPGDIMTIKPISEVFEPGSTFKTFTYAVALAASTVREDELIFCENGKYNIYTHTINDHEKKSYLTARQAFAYSSNIACAKISQRIPKERMIEGFRDFGFWSKTGISLPGEEKGLFPKSNDPFTFMTVSFGQGIGVTPLQLTNAYSAIANGGWLLEPQIVLKISSEKSISVGPGDDGKKFFTFNINARRGKFYAQKKKVVRRVIADSRVIELIKDMLGDVVKYGTGKMSVVEGYNIGGKTGTAQKIDKATGKYSSRDYIASFCGILPLENPRLTILALVDSPTKGDYWGGTIAAPLFARVARETASYLRIPPSLKAPESELVSIMR